jgi:hypothetical protein
MCFKHSLGLDSPPSQRFPYTLGNAPSRTATDECLFPVDTELIESYKSDTLARSLRRLATSCVGSTLYITKCGYIIRQGSVYVPFIEAERIFYEIYDEDPDTSYADMAFYFTTIFYSPEVTKQDMRQWFRACKNLTLDTGSLSSEEEFYTWSDGLTHDVPPPSLVNPGTCGTLDMKTIKELLAYFEESK